jgi:hypothetical protein
MQILNYDDNDDNEKYILNLEQDNIQTLNLGEEGKEEQHLAAIQT